MSQYNNYIDDDILSLMAGSSHCTNRTAGRVTGSQRDDEFKKLELVCAQATFFFCFKQKCLVIKNYENFKVARSSLGEGYQKRKPGVQS